VTRSKIALLAAASLAVAPAALPPPAGAAASCGGKAPRALHFNRSVGAAEGTLSWSGARRAARYRVYRNREVIGQTTRRSVRVQVSPGRRYTFTVRLVGPSGRPARCAARITRLVPFRAPSRPDRLAVREVTDSRVTLDWLPARPGDGRIAGYRVFRDGAVFRQVRGRSVQVPVASARDYAFRVAAADTRGNLGPRSDSVRIRTRHYPPMAPGNPVAVRVTDAEVALRWTAARRRSAPIAGYRVYRDGVPVRQVRVASADLDNLAAATAYRFEVAAVDTLGFVGDPARPAMVTTALPPPTRGGVHAFLLATTDESFRDLQRHYLQIGTLYPTYFDCRASDGAVLGSDDPLVTGWAQLRGIAVLPRFNCQRPETLSLMLNNASVRAATIDRLVALVAHYGYDGINLDFEAGLASDRAALTSFVSSLAGRLHAAGKRVAIEVSAKYRPTTTGRSGFYEYEGLGRAADWVFVMNWGWHWSTSGPGAPDDLAFTRQVADYVATMPNKGRFVLGTSLYGMDWPNGGGPANRATALEYQEIQALIARYHVVPVRDASADSWHFRYTDPGGDFHDVWFADAATVPNRVRLAGDRGLGIGFWRLGTEDQRVWSDPLIAPGASWP
jgi:spore germination protein YaaH